MSRLCLIESLGKPLLKTGYAGGNILNLLWDIDTGECLYPTII